VSNQPKSKQYDLNLGYPDLATVPNTLLAGISSAVLQTGRGLQYGGDLRGILPARQQIAGFLCKQYGRDVQPNELMIATGSVQALDVICRTLTKPGDVVIVESPTFFFAVELFRMSHVEVVGVPINAEGIDLDALQGLIDQYGSRIRFLYTIPSYQNPTGYCASADNRRRVVELARQHDFTVLEDSAYHLLYFHDAPPPLMREFDEDSGHVVTVGTFSKLLAPSLRQGWIWATPEQITRFVSFKTDASTSTLTCEILADYLRRDDINQQIAYLRDFYGRKCARMLEALQRYMPDGVTWTVPGGGFYIWATLPQGIAAKQLRSIVQAQGADFMPGQAAYAGPAEDRYMRLCFAYIAEDLLDGAAQILAAGIRDMMQSR